MSKTGDNQQAMQPAGMDNLKSYTVSPATRLLEKRRQMYEKQEEYENKKKENKQ